MSEYLTPREVAERLRIDRRSVYRHLETGALKADKVGGVWRIKPEHVAAFVVPAVAGDPVAIFDDRALVFQRWAGEIAKGARAAADHAGGGDLRRLREIRDRAAALVTSLVDWRQAGGR